ncbi:cupin domain-containing protein [Sphingobium lactosutens]|uniref:Cupin type-2 domain-containing protein n=1 Tax=Sphingobium lactosutens DS20 TaxID=1331060 RepID=T0HMF7_9SPHN|nr:cupin domain-containing protein [Sphingobium lactosutens]EQB14192.1 hypothetical protein RLDS_14820 [Sphingobium lactosutens DS20]
MLYQVSPDNLRVDALIGQERPAIEADINKPADIVRLRESWATAEAIPVLLMNRDEGIVRDWGRLDVRTLLYGEQSSGRFSVHSILLAPGTELPTHYLVDSHSYVVLTEGEAVLTIGDRSQAVGEYAMGYAPPRTRLGFRNESQAPATIILIQSPAGTERAFAEAHRLWKATGQADFASYAAIFERHGMCFDDTALPRDVLVNKDPEPLDFVIGKDGDIAALREAFERREPLPRLVSMPRDNLSTKATGQNVRKQVMSGDFSAGHAMLTMLGFTPGFGAAPHHQPTEEEFFFIFEGLLEMTCATETRMLAPGGFAFCPRNCTHGFRNRQEAEDTYFMTLNSPAGHERAMAVLREMIRNGANEQQIHDVAVLGGFMLHEPTLPVNEKT